MSDIVSQLVKLSPILTPLATFLVGYYGSRINRQNNLNNDSTKIEGIYAGTQKELLVQINQLTKDKLELADDIVDLKEEISKLQTTVNNLNDQIEDYKKMITTTKK